MPSVKVVSAGVGADAEFPVASGVIIGRDVSADIALASPGISRRHVQFLVEKDGAVWVEDLNSSNGTFVNGAKVTRHRLADGDTIQLNDVVLRYSLADPTPVRRTQRRDTAPPTEPVNTDVIQELLRQQELIDQDVAVGGGEPATDSMGRQREGAPPPARPAATAERPARHDTAIPAYAIIDDDDDESPGDAWSYSFDVTGSFTSVLDVKLAPPERVAALEKRLQLLFDVSRTLATVTERDQLFARILDKLHEVYPHADVAAIFLGPRADLLLPVMTRHRERGQTGRALRPSRTIATQVFDQKKAILCHDASADERFASAESISDLRLKAFMVAPLLYQGHEVSGFLQLQSPDRFTRDDLEVLAALAASAALFLKNLDLFEGAAHQAKEREAIQSELRIASSIQAQLVPAADPTLSWLQVSGRMRNAKHVGGDCFDYLEAPDGALHVVIGDVSGKGVPAGLVMVSARSILHALVSRSGPDADPRTIAIDANRLLRRGLKPGMFLSLLLGRCDEARSSIRFAGCGHERPLVYRAATGQVEVLALGGTVLGVVEDNSAAVDVAEVVLAPGDQVLLVTDGVTEAMDILAQRYTATRLAETFARHGALPPPALIAAIEADLAEHVGLAEQHDDITMIALRRV